MAFRVDQRVQFPATATATLLVVDAWFDMTTSGEPRGQFFEALVLAVFVEIPAAVFSIYVAHSGQPPALWSWPVWPARPPWRPTEEPG